MVSNVNPQGSTYQTTTGNVTDTNGVENDTTTKKQVTYTANGVTKTLNAEDSLQTFEADEEMSTEERSYNNKVEISNQKKETLEKQIQILEQQLEDLRKSKQELIRQLGAGGEISSVTSSLQSISQSINQVYDKLNNAYISMLQLETDLDATTMEYLNSTSSGGGTSTMSTKPVKFREGASEDGKNVVNTALQYDDKNQSQMKSIMKSKGYRFDDGRWCADFATFILGEAYGRNNIPGDFINTCSNTAGCGSIKSWSQGNGSWTKDIDSLQPGDLIIFDWADTDSITDHVGIFISKNADGTINTIEGNTSGAAGSSCVEQKVRAPQVIHGAVRLSGLA